TRLDEETLVIDPSEMRDVPLLGDAVQKLRASYYFMGALLGKYGKCLIKSPGGCY
ncbi:UDP-N-acetylglucosamine 1-carboxyvinyltransferase, partial [gut metagenome]